MVSVSSNAGKFAAASPALAGMCSFCNAFPIQCTVVLKPSLKRNGPVVKMRASISKTALLIAFLFCAANVFCCRYSLLPLMEPLRERMYGAGMLDSTLVRYEH